MVRYVRNTIVTIREVAGIDIHLLPDGGMLFFGAQLKLAGGKVKTVKNIHRVKDVKELKGTISEKVPLSVSMNGHGVMMRKIAPGNNSNLISNILPGSNPNDFLYTIHKINEQEQIAFIIRKSKVEETIGLFETAGLRIISLSLGTEGVENILPFIDRSKQTLSTLTLAIDVSDQKVVSVRNTDKSEDQLFKEIRIGDQVFRKSESIGVGNALNLLHKPADSIGSNISTSGISHLQKDYVYYKLFQFTKWTVMASTLALLLINFVVFNYYFKKNKKLTEMNNLALALQQQNTLAGEKLDSSYSFFMRSGWNKNTRYGFYIDRIAALVPSSVSFKSLDVAPLQESLGVNDYLFSKNRIVISGVSNNPSELETFSRALKNIEGVESTALKNYSYKEDLNAAVFTIEITIKT